MKRLLLLFISIILGFRIYSQDRFFVSFEASPIYSYRSYKLIDYSNGNSNFPSGKILYNDFKHYCDSIESPKFGYNFGFNIGYGLTDKFSIIIGIHYKKIGYKINMNFPVAHFVYNGYIQPIYSEYQKLDLYSNLYYIGIPIGFQYKVYSINRFNIGLNICSSLDLLIKHDTKYLPSPNTKSKEDYSDYSKMAIDINGGIQLGYMINDKFEVYLMPHFSDYITSNVKVNAILTDDFFVKINQYNYYGDIIIGFKYKL